MTKESIKQIANNKKAFHDYFVEESFECGIQLFGTEVKSLRLGQASIKEAFCQIRNGECFVVGMHINPYERGNIFNKDALRDRKLLLHKQEIHKLLGKIKEQGYTLMPLSLYFKGKKLYDKREDMKKKAQRRELEKEFKKANIRV